MRLPLDADYALSMMRFAARFCELFGISSEAVKTDIDASPPPPDWWLDASLGLVEADERKAYLAFLEKTREVAKSAQVVTVVRPAHVQRSPHRGRFFLQL
jgi:hypothetical protein